MKKSHLRWLIPLIVCVIATGVAIYLYQRAIYDSIVLAKEKEMALEVSVELRKIDVEISQAIAVVNTTGNIMTKLRMDDNRNQIVGMLENVLEECSATYALVCDQKGIGFDKNNKDVDISGEAYYEELVTEYSNGGVGMILPRNVQTTVGEVYLVYGAKFSNKGRGFLIASLPVRTLNEKLFRDEYISEKQAVITLSGEILCSKGFELVNARSNTIWEKLPAGVSKDSVKLAISQKNTYMSQVPDYGYIIVEPLDSAGGGAVVLITDEQMNRMVAREMTSGYMFMAAMVLISVAFALLVLVANVISDRIEKARRLEASEEKETDPVTGLLSEAETYREIDSYAAEGADKKGMLFVIGTNISVDKAMETPSGIDNDTIREFARVLRSGFRASDVVGRTGDGEFTVFLRGVHEEKDIRKQTDEMQMFLHDVTSESEEGKLVAHAGAVLFPDRGRNSREIMESGRRALERARQQGAGRLSF